MKTNLNNSINIDLHKNKEKKRTFLVFAFELDEVVDETIIKILFTKVGITSSSLYFEIILVNRSIVEQYTERSSKNKDENIMLTRNLSVQTIGDCSSHGLLKCGKFDEVVGQDLCEKSVV